MLSVEDYREYIQDYDTPDEQIMAKLLFLDAFCKNVIETSFELYERRKQQTNEIYSDPGEVRREALEEIQRRAPFYLEQERNELRKSKGRPDL